MRQSLKIEIVQGDALVTPTDVLALKYAQSPYGVDSAVARLLVNYGILDVEPSAGSFRITPGKVVSAASNILFVGVPHLQEFEYREIRELSFRILSILSREAPTTRVLTVTLHGTGYGLDERECFLSELAGLTDAVTSGEYPASLELIKIVELNKGRADRLNNLLDSYLPGGNIEFDTRERSQRIGEERSETLRGSATTRSKNRIFSSPCHFRKKPATCTTTVLSRPSAPAITSASA